MIDLDAKMRSLVERNIPRKDIVSELDAIASDAESRAKRFERAKKKGDRYRAESERALSARVGRILFFLHHGYSRYSRPSQFGQPSNRLLNGRLVKWFCSEDGTRAEGYTKAGELPR